MKNKLLSSFEEKDIPDHEYDTDSKKHHHTTGTQNLHSQLGSKEDLKKGSKESLSLLSEIRSTGPKEGKANE
jgi:hypothetical protein